MTRRKFTFYDVSGGRINRTEASSQLSRAQSFSVFALMLLATAGLGLGFFRYYGDVLEQPVAPEQVVQDFSAPENCCWPLIQVR